LPQNVVEARFDEDETPITKLQLGSTANDAIELSEDDGESVTTSSVSQSTITEPPAALKVFPYPLVMNITSMKTELRCAGD
jgi:hypothetical protein